ncbi:MULTISPECIES: antirestriction protein ArdA [Bacillales]|uniref:antirestriction protein ArdA n=1 Tax=Bacillales TaxID=1385 RepID=UPI001145761E|nr:antirestriction protein ArdA [Bacillus cereus]
MKFSITLANLGVYNEGALHAEIILFPAETEEIAAAYNRVSYSGMNFASIERLKM